MILRGQQSQVDFIAQSAQKLLLEQLNHYMQSGEGQDADSLPKGLLLYEQSPTFILNLPKEIEFDQIPFTASLLSTAPQNKGFLDRRYPILLSNLVLDWMDAAEFIRTMQRLLAPEGRCWFSTYGEQTAVQSKSVLAELDAYPHFNAFYNLQDMGDALLGNGFKEVVVESHIIKLEYTSVDVLVTDANKIFGVNLHPDRLKTLSTRSLFKTFCQRVEQIIQVEGKYVETVEIMLAHAKMPSIKNVIPVMVS